MSSPPASGWQPAPDVLCEILDGEAMLLKLDTGVYFSLNATGARLWELLESGELDRAVDVLEREYEVGRETLEKDVAELLDDLARRDLIRPRERA